MSDEPTFEEFMVEGIRRQDWQNSITHPVEDRIKREFAGPIGICFLSDLHMGATSCDYRQLAIDVRTIRDTQGLYTILNGDEIQNYIIGNLAGVSRHDIFQPTEQNVLFAKLLDALMPKIVAATLGNHNEWTQKVSGINLRAEQLNAVSVSDLGYGGTVEVVVGDVSYVIHIRHKYLYNSTINPFHTIIRLHENHGPFDIGVVGHTHEAAIGTFDRQGKTVVAVRPGAYKVKDSYARACGFMDARAISPTVVLFPGSKKIQVFESVVSAASYLKYLRK